MEKPSMPNHANTRHSLIAFIYLSRWSLGIVQNPRVSTDRRREPIRIGQHEAVPKGLVLYVAGRAFGLKSLQLPCAQQFCKMLPLWASFGYLRARASVVWEAVTSPVLGLIFSLTAVQR